MKLYETTFILDPELKDDGFETAVSKYSGVITGAGAIKNVYRWGLRRMAYEIDKHSHGYYVHIIHESDPSVPVELERQFRLDESCIRHMTVLAENLKYLEEMEKGAAQQAAESEAAAARPETRATAPAAPEATEAPVAPVAEAEPQKTERDADSADSDERTEI